MRRLRLFLSLTALALLPALADAQGCAGGGAGAFYGRPGVGGRRWALQAQAQAAYRAPAYAAGCGGAAPGAYYAPQYAAGCGGGAPAPGAYYMPPAPAAYYPPVSYAPPSYYRPAYQPAYAPQAYQPQAYYYPQSYAPEPPCPPGCAPGGQFSYPPSWRPLVGEEVIPGDVQDDYAPQQQFVPHYAPQQPFAPHYPPPRAPAFYPQQAPRVAAGPGGY